MDMDEETMRMRARNPPPPPHLNLLQCSARGMAPTPNKDSTCWDDVAVPEEINFLYDGVDKSMLHQAVRESKAIVGRIMDKIYPGWQWGSTRRHFSFIDGATRVRHPEDVTISEILQIFLGPDTFTTPLWKMINGKTSGVDVDITDLVPFMKVSSYPIRTTNYLYLIRTTY